MGPKGWFSQDYKSHVWQLPARRVTTFVIKHNFLFYRFVINSSDFGIDWDWVWLGQGYIFLLIFSWYFKVALLPLSFCYWLHWIVISAFLSSERMDANQLKIGWMPMLMISKCMQQLNSELIMNDNLINVAFFHHY